MNQSPSSLPAQPMAANKLSGEPQARRSKAIRTITSRAIDPADAPGIMDIDNNGKVKSRWTRSFFTALNRRNDDERFVCDICNKDLASPSSLTLHRNTHVIERRYKCEPCQVSFHSQGHLQKHMRSIAHETRVEMTQSFGIPTSDNPRPYDCPECDVAFRKHGHLAKHLRSKSHVTKLEANGLVPQGTYAAFEKSGAEIRERLITTNCEVSLQSLRAIAMTLLGDQQPIQTNPREHRPARAPASIPRQQYQNQQIPTKMPSPHRLPVISGPIPAPLPQLAAATHLSGISSGPDSNIHVGPMTPQMSTTNIGHHQIFQPVVSQHHIQPHQQLQANHHFQPQFASSHDPILTTISPPISGIVPLPATSCASSSCPLIEPVSSQHTITTTTAAFNTTMDCIQSQSLSIVHRDGTANGIARHHAQQAMSHHWNQHHLQMDDCYGLNSSPPHTSPTPPHQQTGVNPLDNRPIDRHLNGQPNGSHHQHQFSGVPPISTYPLDVLSQTHPPLTYQSPQSMLQPVQSTTTPTTIYNMSANINPYQQDNS